MKRLLIAAALFLVPMVAEAQVALDIDAGALPQDQFNAIRDTRWMPMTVFPDVTATISHRIPVMMDGRVQEVWAVTDPNMTMGAVGLRVGVAISKRNGAMTTIADMSLNTTAAMGGEPQNMQAAQFRATVILQEGDNIVIGVYGSYPTANRGVTVGLRIAN